jgi:hypothetical protein
MTREQIIRSMCLTFRHDFELRRDPDDPFQNGMTEAERDSLLGVMGQIFDNDIAPYMEFKNGTSISQSSEGRPS